MTRSAWPPLATLLITAVCIAQSAPLSAQGTFIDGVGGLPWGTTRASLEAQLGGAVHVDTLVLGVTALGYIDEIAGEAATAVYLVHPRRGLIGATFSTLELTSDCEETFSALRDSLAVQYVVEPKVNRFNATDGGFCCAVKSGTAGWMVTWEAAGSSVGLTMTSESRGIVLSYESPSFLGWSMEAACRSPQGCQRP